jgi:hypothetical protein
MDVALNVIGYLLENNLYELAEQVRQAMLRHKNGRLDDDGLKHIAERMRLRGYRLINRPFHQVRHQ